MKKFTDKIRSNLSRITQASLVNLNADYQQRKRILEQNILFKTEKGITDERYADQEIIVSLTTYGKRLFDVALTIESIMEQTMKANRIVLWLQKDLEPSLLPGSLKLLQKRGLEIAFCRDLRSYKKIIPSLLKYPDDVVITVDDDLLYEYDLLEHLITAYLNTPQYIYCHRSHRMKLDENGHLLAYSHWDWEHYFDKPDILCFPTGSGGVLYPPHTLSEEVINDSVFMDICPYADDVWLKAMALKKGTLSTSVYSHHQNGRDYLINESVQDVGLCKFNVDQNMNDRQILAVFEKYDLYKLLR